VGGDGQRLPVWEWLFGADQPPFAYAERRIALELQNKISPPCCSWRAVQTGEEHRAVARRNAERLADRTAKDQPWLLSLS